MFKKLSALLIMISLFAMSCTASQDAGALPESLPVENTATLTELVGDDETAVATLPDVSEPQNAVDPTAAQPASLPVAETETTDAPPTIDQAQYVNDVFGLSFLLPANWFGPEEYVSEQTLRVEVATDPVYPYGTDPTERPEALANAYHIVVQYDKDGQYGDLNSTYQSLAALQDGESLSDARGKIIRVRPLALNGLEGFEYIATLSETAQTSPVYIRMSLLMDAQGNFLTVLGTPSQVELADGTSWQEAYQQIDEANLSSYHFIVESISIPNE